MRESGGMGRREMMGFVHVLHSTRFFGSLSHFPFFYCCDCLIIFLVVLYFFLFYYLFFFKFSGQILLKMLSFLLLFCMYLAW